MSGHIQKLGDERWRLYVYAGRDPVTGRSRQVTKVVRGTRKDADRALAKLVLEVDAGGHDGEARAFGQVLDDWLAHKALSVQGTTLDTYRNSAAYVTDHLRAKAVDKITVADLEALYAHLLIRGRKRAGQAAAGLGHAAVVNVHAAIHGALELARRRKYVTHNVAGDAEVPRGRKRKPTPVASAALPALFAEAQRFDPRLKVFIRASIAAGTRRSEMHGLRWSGVDFERGTVTISDVVVREGGRWVIKEWTKTEADRTVYVGEGTLDGLRRMYDDAFVLAGSCGIVLPPAAFVFSDDPAGATPWKPQTTARRFSRCCEAAGLPKGTRIHDLRALCGTYLADQGVPIPVIGQRLGHTLNSTTADIYVGRISESDRRAAIVIEQLFGD